MGSLVTTPKANSWDASLYFLGETLHMPIYKIKAEMPLSEFIGWNKHFTRKNSEAPGAPASKFDTSDPSSVLKAFGC